MINQAMKIFSDNYLEKALAAASLTGLHYLIKMSAALYSSDFQGILVTGFRITKESITSWRLPQTYQLLPVIIFWIMVGILAYFIFFSLQLAYSNIEELIIHQIFFTKVADDNADRFPIRVLKRLAIHSMVIITYLLTFTLAALLIFPAINRLWQYGDSYLMSKTNLEATVGIGLTLVFVLWYVLLSLMVALLKKTKNLLWEEKLAEAHGLDQG